jgi:hypothetical protein
MYVGDRKNFDKKLIKKLGQIRSNQVKFDQFDQSNLN